MQYNKTRKKDNYQESSRMDESMNASVNSGFNTDSYRRGRETAGRQMHPAAEEFNTKTNESGYKEVLFLDPHDNLRRTNYQAPITEGRQTPMTQTLPVTRSPMRQSVLSTVRQDLNERHDTAQIVGKRPIPTLTVQIPLRKDDLEYDRDRSPKTINLAGGHSPEEYGTRSMRHIRSPRESYKLNPREYGIDSMGHNQDSHGNVFLDHPVNVHGSVNDANNYSRNSFRNQVRTNEPYARNTNREREREIQFATDRNINNSRENTFSNELGRDSPPNLRSLKNKMSPNRNEDDREINSNRFDRSQHENDKSKIDDLKRMSQMAERSKSKFRGKSFIPNDSTLISADTSKNPYHSPNLGENYISNDLEDDLMYNDRTHEGVHQIYQDYGGDIERLMKMKQLRDTQNEDPLKKSMRRRTTNEFKPKIKREGKLAPVETQVMSPIANDTIFPDRRTVLMKMNKLSHILMSKSRSVEAVNRSQDDSSSYNPLRRTDDNKFSSSASIDPLRKTQGASRSPTGNKFIRVTMAMLSSKGPNCEDRIITRVMRFDKGGVVDFAQNTQKNKKYEVKQFNKRNEKSKKPPRKNFTGKEREKAAKTVQGWWREILSRYRKAIDKVITIQKVWRGHWIRTYIYEIIYSTILVENFIDRVKTPIVKNIRKNVFDKLLPHAAKFVARKNLMAILKIQRQVRHFLSNMGNKKNKLPMLIDKMFIRRKKHAFEKLKKNANITVNLDKAQQRKKGQNLFLHSLKRVMRVRIFHNLLFTVFDRPVIVLKSLLLKNVLRNNFKRLNRVGLRLWVNKWMKDNSRNSDASNKNENATAPQNPEAIQAVKDLKNKVLGKFLLNTAKNLEKRVLKQKLRLWKVDSDPEKKKDLEGLVGSNRLPFSKTKKVTRNYDGVKANVLKKLMNKDMLHKLPLRRKLNLWKKVTRRGRKLELAGRIISGLGSKMFKLNIQNILQRRFLDWKRKCNMMNFLENSSSKDNNDKKKHFAAVRLANSTNKCARKMIFRNTLPYLMKYFDKLTQQNAVKKLLLMRPKFKRVLIFNFWNRWRNNIAKQKQKDIRTKFFENLVKNTKGKILKNMLRKKFVWWRVPKAAKNPDLKYFHGSEILLKALYKRNMRKPLYAFKEKIDLDLAKEGVLKAFDLKDKYLKRHWREYLLRWWKNADKLKLKELRNGLTGKLLATSLGKMRVRMLANKLSLWRKAPKVNMAEVYERCRNLSNLPRMAVSKVLSPLKRHFMDRLQNYKGEEAYRKAIHILGNLAINGKFLKLREAMDLWRIKNKNIEIHDLKSKLLRLAICQAGIKNKKISLAHAFARWNRNLKLDDLMKHGQNNIFAYKGTNILETLRLRRLVEFFGRLKRLMNLDTRGLILLNIKKRLALPRVSIAHCLDRWRRNNETGKKNEAENGLKQKILKDSCKKLQTRFLRDSLLKKFILWKGKPSKPQDYYLRMAEGVNDLDGLVKSRCREPFTKVQNFKNYRKLITNVLPISSKLAQKAKKQAMLRLWNKWKKAIAEEKTKLLNTKILEKLSGKLWNKYKLKLLSKAFRLWSRKSSLHFPNMVKGINKINEVLQKPWKSDILNRLTLNSEAKNQRDCLMSMMRTSKTFNLIKLRNYMRHWWKLTLYNTDNLKSKSMKTMKRHIVSNYVLQPLEKYFRLWNKKLSNKPKVVKRLQNACDLLKNGLKKNLQEPFNKIKDHRSPNALSKAMLYHVLPNSEKLMNRIKKESLSLWKKKSDKLKLKDMHLRLLNTLYRKNKIALSLRFLRRYFNRWRVKPEEPQPIDLHRIIAGEKAVYQTLAKKYLPNFVPDLKNYSNKKFLRDCLLKSSKYHLRSLKPFFLRWKDRAEQLKDKETKANMIGKLLGRSLKLQQNKDIQNILRRRFNFWKTYPAKFDAKVLNQFPRSADILNKYLKKKNLPKVMGAVRSKNLKLQKNYCLENVKAIGAKVLFTRLRHALALWRGQTQKQNLKNFKNDLMSKHLKRFAKKMDSNRLQRSLLLWKGLMIGKGNLKTIQIGALALKKLLLRQPFSALKENTKMMNLKVPFGVSLKDALINFNPNIAKNIAIKTMLVRPRFLRWAKNVEAMKQNDLKLEIFKKLMNPQMRNKGRILLRKALLRWWTVKNDEDRLNLTKKFHANLLTKSYEKNSKILLRRHFKLWAGVTAENLKKLSDISLGVIKLRHKSQRDGLHGLLKRLQQEKDHENKFDQVKRNMTSAFRKNDAANLFFCFARWRKIKYLQRESELKHKILKNMINKFENKADEDAKNSLHEKFLRWRLRARPKDYLSNISNVRRGGILAKKGAAKKVSRDVFDKIKDKARAQKTKEVLYSFIANFDKKAEEYLLNGKLRLWKIRVGDTPIMVRKLRNLVDAYVANSPIAHDELYKKPSNDINDCLKSYAEMKTKNAATIQDYCKNLVNIFRRMRHVQKIRNLHKVFGKCDLKTALKAKTIFSKWARNATRLSNEHNSKIIQRFLRNKMNKLKTLRERIEEGSGLLRNHIKRESFVAIKERAKLNRRQQLLLRLTKDYPEEVKKEFQKKYFLRWWRVVLRDHEEAASTKITNALRGLLAKKFRDLLIKRKARLNDMMIKLTGKWFDKTQLYFNKWLLDTRMHKCEVSAKIIHKFLRGKMQNVKKTNAEMKLREMFRMRFIKMVKQHIDTASKINIDRGQILPETLQRIFVQRPFDKIKEAAKWGGRVKSLRNAFPKVYDKLRKYLLPHYLRLWKIKTWDDTVKKTIMLQNMMRSRWKLFRLRNAARKEQLINKYTAKLTNDFTLKQQLALKLWSKLTKIKALHDTASGVQALWKGHTSRKNLDRQLNQQKVRALLRKNYLKKLADAMVQTSDFSLPLRNALSSMEPQMERRYTTNNLIDLANNAIRNAYMHHLTNRREFLHQRTLLREYFDRMKEFCDVANDSAIMLQKKFRKLAAKKKLDRLSEMKQRMGQLYNKYDIMEIGNKKAMLKRWRNVAETLKVNEKAGIIQKYLKFKYSRHLNSKFREFFYERAKQITHHRVNFAVKEKKLVDAIRKPYLKIFLERLDNKLRSDKIKWLFVKRFNNLDDQLKGLYLKRYVDLWKSQARKLTIKRNASALAIMSLWKGHLARKFAALLLKKKAKMTEMMLRLSNSMEHKQKLYLRLWYGKARTMKLEESANVLRDFMSDVKDKHNKIKAQRRLVKLRDGLFLVRKAWMSGAERNSLDKVKSEANRNLLIKVGNDVEKKKKDHLQTAHDNIKNRSIQRQAYLNKCAGNIQKKFNLFKYRKGIWNVIEKIRKMRHIAKMMMDRNYRIQTKALRLWQRKALGEKTLNSAKTIQNFINSKVLRWRNNEKIKSMEKLRSLFRNNFVNVHLRPCLKDFVTAVKLDRMFLLMRIYAFKRFKDNIIRFEKMTAFSNATKLCPKFRLRLLKKKFDQYKTQVDKLRRKRAAELIQRNWRLHKIITRLNNISSNMKKILFKLSGDNDDIKKYYLRLWNKNNKNAKIKHAADVINDFVYENFKRIQAKKKWWRLSEGLNLKNNILNGVDFAKRYKQMRGIGKLFDKLGYKAKKDGFEQLKEQSKLNRIGKILKGQFFNHVKKSERLTVDYSLRLWDAKAKKLVQRDKALVNFRDLYTRRFTTIAAQRVNEASLMKKLFLQVEKIRAKDAFKNIKWRAENKKKLASFGENLKKADDFLTHKNLNLFANKLYHLYYYKTIDRLVNRISMCQKSKIGPFMGRKFFNKLKANAVAKSAHTYEDKKSNVHNNKPKMLSFKSEIVNPKRRLLEVMKAHPTQFMAPHLGNFLEELFRRRKRWGFDKFKYLQRIGQGKDKVYNHANTLVLPDKKLFLQRVKDLAEYNARTPNLLASLFKLLRRNWIRKVTVEVPPIARIVRIMNLVKVTEDIKEYNNRLIKREIARKWRFMVTMQSIAKAKMEAMYKNMQQSYLFMASEMFGESSESSSSSSSVVKEFEDYDGI
jgi:hypothetical protein